MEATLNGPFGRILLGSIPLTIGRAPDNQLVVNDPKASSRHAEIRPQGQDYAIIDLGSMNGSFLNGQRLTPQVPNLLHAGDTVRIGDTELRYEVTGLPQHEPTVYAGPGQGSDPYSTPTVATPPYNAYVSDIQPVAYVPPPAPFVPSSSVPSTYPPPAPPYYGMPAPAPIQQPKRRGLWITLGITGGVVLIALIVLGVLILVNRSTPTRTLNAFCNALKAGDYTTAYSQLSSAAQSQVGSETEFASASASNGGLGMVRDCSLSNVNDGTGTGTISYSLAGGSMLVDDYTLVTENSNWKIKSEKPRSVPSLTLAIFCTALKSEDYQTAYNQLSSSLQSQGTESQFAASFSSNKVTDCAVSTVNNAAGTGTIRFTLADGSTNITDFMLITESGAWKINSGHTRS